MQEERTGREKNGTGTSLGAVGVGARRLVRFATEELLWGCGAWLLGQAMMLFDTYPLGLAMLCASTKHTISILAGLLLTTISNFSDPVVYICTYLAAAVIRVFASMILDTPDARFTLPDALKKKIAEAEPLAEEETRKKRLKRRLGEAEGEAGRLSVLWEEIRDIFSESVCLRIATAAVCSLIVGLWRIISGGFRYYDLFAAVFSVLFVAVAVTVFSVCMEQRSHSKLLIRISGWALLFSFVWAANTVALLSFPLSPMMALFFSLYASAERGAKAGIGTALVCGIAYAPIYAPACLFASLTYLFLSGNGKSGGAVLGACSVSVLWSVYVGGAAMLFSAVPASLIAGTAFTLFQKLLKKQGAEEKEAEKEVPYHQEMERIRYRDANERFRGISNAFSSLSEMFYNLSDRFRRPGTLDLRRLCDTAFDSYCKDCPNKTVCWGLEYSDTLGAVNDLIAQLHTKGKVSKELIPAHLRHRCGCMDGVLEKINTECAKLTAEMLRDNRTEIFAMDYESAAQIINDALEEDDGEYHFDGELERRIGEYLKDADVKCGGVTVYGRRLRRILIRGADLEHAKVSTETLRCDLGEMCSSELGEPMFEVERNVSTMILQAKQKIAVVGAQNNVSSDGGVSGDTVNLFSNKKDFFYALISDGMGAGREAALTSNLCSVFMEKMLRAGNRANTSLRMLNNMISSRHGDSTRECSTTVDLLELDLMTGEASFIKSGAAPSYVIRGNVVRRLQSGTVPIGIIGTLDAQKTSFDLKEGDTVVMISDGILQSDLDGVWLASFLKTVGRLTPDQIVYQICLHAAENEKHDDCSAIALRIQKAE